MEKVRLGMIGVGNMGSQVASMLIKNKRCPEEHGLRKIIPMLIVMQMRRKCTNPAK